jgi:DNA-binding transcriptional MocR family regulator
VADVQRFGVAGDAGLQPDRAIEPRQQPDGVAIRTPQPVSSRVTVPAAARSVASGPHVDFRTRSPDLSAFPRSQWLRSMRNALAAMPNEELDYGEAHGTDGPLRRARGIPRQSAVSWRIPWLPDQQRRRQLQLLVRRRAR